MRSANSPDCQSLEIFRQYDGAERVPLLPPGRFVGIAATTRTDEPASVEIEWDSGQFERPFPGSSLWRAMLERRLAEPERPDPTDAVFRDQLEQSLVQYPDLESWWHWLRTGWTNPPQVPPANTASHRKRLRWLSR